MRGWTTSGWISLNCHMPDSPWEVMESREQVEDASKSDEEVYTWCLVESSGGDGGLASWL